MIKFVIILFALFLTDRVYSQAIPDTYENRYGCNCSDFELLNYGGYNPVKIENSKYNIEIRYIGFSDQRNFMTILKSDQKEWEGAYYIKFLSGSVNLIKDFTNGVNHNQYRKSIAQGIRLDSVYTELVKTELFKLHDQTDIDDKLPKGTIYIEYKINGKSGSRHFHSYEYLKAHPNDPESILFFKVNDFFTLIANKATRP
ncbi:MAG: hypothetical protein JWR50_3751 [Mucilaginibacter sp.]|nr:hypothetical protein [Mucilaginibacter sp.]